MMNLLSGICYATAAGITFGGWQHNFSAGVFMFNISMLFFISQGWRND